MPDAPDPPRKNYAFKPKEFERLNAPRPDAPPSDAPQPHASTGPNAATPPNAPGASSAAGAAHSPAPPEPPEPTPAANDVFAIQRELREREIAAGMDELAPPHRPVRSRRKRDYWLLTILTNGVLLPLALWGYRTQNAVLFVYCIAGLALVNAALTWIMWVLMDDY
ncbi:MAG: hypothetical protein HYV96_19785 [Opitutae bacterium]|nr:hypothetical protein [Opitutae bacterium]